ncbi:MAG: hypothetical protein M1816_007611 [Peltula sp. TS41687]|nr:MAG: hypothetical protein M1816_007611 [Peltula sp. TS41687]
MTISSFIVFIFTTLLFLSGYILQRRTVHDIQRAINPSPRPSPSPGLPVSGSISISVSSAVSPQASSTTSPLPSPPPLDTIKPPPQRPRHAAAYPYQEYLSPTYGRRGSTRVAYARLVTSHIHVCDAVVFFAELCRARNTADRVLLYPRAWDTTTSNTTNTTAATSSDEEEVRRRLDTTRRLLGLAASMYGARVLPVDPLLEGADPNNPASYPLSTLLALTNYDRLLAVSPSGLLLDPNSLDELFDTPLDAPMTAFPSPPPTVRSGSSSNDQNGPDAKTNLPASAAPPAAFLLQPSKTELARLKQLLASDPSLADPAMLLSHYYHPPPDQQSTATQHASPSPYSPPSSSSAEQLILQTFSLLLDDHHQQEQQKRQPSLSMILASTAYIHIVSHPGPEYAVERSVDHARGEEASRIWEWVYERFREERMGVCGLDLERWDGDGEG